MRQPKFTQWASVVALASLTLGGCSSDLPSSNSTEVLKAQPELSKAVKDRFLDRVGRGLAVALNDPAVRAWVSKEIVSSPYVEYRIPLRDKVLNQSSRPEVRTIGRAAALSTSDLALLRRFPPLELYLPVESQRSSWRGGADVQVAVRRSTEDYTLFQTDGSRAVVPEKYTSPRATLVLAISEIDYADRESAVRGGKDTGEGMQQAFAPPIVRPTFSLISTATMGVDPSKWTRSFQHFIIVAHDGGWAGDDEMEIFGRLHVQGSAAEYPECRRYAGLEQGVQYTRDYGGTPLGIAEAIAIAVPTGNDWLHIEAWEDDDTKCSQRPADDKYGELELFREAYNVQWRLIKGPNSTTFDGDAKIGVRAYVNGQPDPLP